MTPTSPTESRTSASTGSGGSLQALVVPMRRIAVTGYLGAAAVALAGAAIGYAVAGSAGVWGALLGVALPVAFLSVTVVTALLTARLSATPLGAVLLGTWLLKIVVLIAVLAWLQDATFYSRGVFFGVFAPTLMGYLLLEAWVGIRTRLPYVGTA